MSPDRHHAISQLKAAEAFKLWWRDEGSAISPLPHEDREEHAKRVSLIAWMNAAYLCEHKQ